MGSTIPPVHTAKEASHHIKGLLSPERLTELAEAGYMPCWRVDGGPPLFVYDEVRRYVLEHMIRQIGGTPFPPVLPVPVLEPHEIQPPPVLSQLGGLRAYAEQAIPTCVYFLVNGAKVQYVGQSVLLVGRVYEHRKAHRDFESVFFLPVPRSDLNYVEAAFIRCLKPPLNGDHPSVPAADIGKDPFWLQKYGFKAFPDEGHAHDASL